MKKRLLSSLMGTMLLLGVQAQEIAFNGIKLTQSPAIFQQKLQRMGVTP